MTNESLAQGIVTILRSKEQKIVFAESCTAGLLSAAIASIVGASDTLCGSAVTYRPKLKRSWLHVKQSTIKTFTTESIEVAQEMAIGVLRQCREADWSVAVVGHMGPNSPVDKDGHIDICIARRTKKGKLKGKDVLHYQCHSKDRAGRLQEATEAVLTHLSRRLFKKERQTKKTVESK